MWISNTPEVSTSKFTTADVEVMLLQAPKDDNYDFRLLLRDVVALDIVSETATIELPEAARPLVEKFLTRAGQSIQTTKDGIKFQSEFIVFKKGTTDAICVAFIDDETQDCFHADPTIDSSLMVE